MYEIRLELSTAPATEPVTTSEVKSHCRVDISDDDTLISGLITSSRMMAETITRRAIITQTWKLYLDGFPCEREIYLPNPPLQSITSVTYLDTNGDLQTLSSSLYDVDIRSILGRIVLKPGESWPSTQVDRVNVVTITFVAGYGNAGAVPEPIKLAIKQLAAHAYENRELKVIGPTISDIPQTAEWLLWPYRAMRFF